MALSQAVRAMRSAASRCAHGLACADGFAAAAHCEMSRPHRGGRDHMMRMGTGGATLLPLMPRLSGQYTLELSGNFLMHMQEAAGPAEMTQMDSI